MLAGCENQQAKQRAELREAVETANAALREATLVVAEPDNTEAFERSRAKLTGAISTLRSARADGETGQESAINQILADAHRRLAAMDLAKMNHMAQSVRDAHALVRQRVSSLQRLNAFVAAVDSIDISDETDELETAASSASAELDAISEQLAELDGPIATLTSENSEDASRIRQLRQQAQELMGKASELGAARGIDQYVAAVDKRLQANEIESTVAQRELNLAYNYQPQQQMADTQARQLQELLSTLKQARENLNEIASTISSEVSKTRQRIESLRSGIEQTFNEAQRTLEQDVEQAYQSGLQAADEALNAARRASRNATGDERDSAKMLEAQIFETRGRLHWARARVLEGRIDLLQRLGEAGDALSDSAGYRNQLSEAREAYNQTMELAREAYTNAQSAMPSGQSTQLNAMRRSIELALGALEGKNLDDIELSTPANAGGSTARTGGAANGFESPQALLNALQSIDPQDPEGMMIVFDIIHPTSPLQNRVLDTARNMSQTMVELFRLMERRFGAQATQGAGPGMGSNMPDFASATIEQTAEDRAVATVSSADATGGGTEELQMVRVDGRWWLAFDSFNQMAGEEQLSLDQNLQMMNALTQSIQDIINKIEGGAITSEQQAGQAIMGAFFGAMQEAGADMGSGMNMGGGQSP